MRIHAVLYSILVVMFSTAAFAAHVGQKAESPRTVEHAGQPVIIHLSADRLDFTSTLSEPVILTVFDVLGNPVEHRGTLHSQGYPVNGAGSFALDLNGLRSGMYFVTVRNSAGIAAVGVAELR